MKATARKVAATRRTVTFVVTVTLTHAEIETIKLTDNGGGTPTAAYLKDALTHIVESDLGGGR